MRLDYAVFSERVSFVVLYHNFGDYTIEKTNKSFSKVFPPDLLSGSRARSCSQTAGLLNHMLHLCAFFSVFTKGMTHS